MLRFLIAVAALASMVAPRAAWAASPPEPAAIERTIPSQSQQRTAAPALSMPARERRDQPASDRRFTLGAVNIDGATVFTQEQLSRYFEPYLATEVDQRKLARVADAITARYRETGYLLSYALVPSQSVEAGMVRMAVVEGRIGSVVIEGAGTSTAAIESIADPLTKNGPVRSGELERTIGLIRDFPGVTVTDVALTRSDIRAGLYSLRIKIAPDRVRTFTYADNRGTGSIGRSRVYQSFAISSVGVQGDELRVDLFAMPGGRSRYLYGQVAGAVPLGRHGLRLSVTASRGDQYLRAGEHFDGTSDNVSAQLSYPLIRGRSLTIVGKAGLTDWRTAGKQNGTRKLRDRLRVARLGIEFGNEGRTKFQGELSLSRGLGFAAMTRVGDPLASRSDASGRFNKAALSLHISRPLDDRLTLRGTALAQYSDRPLLSAEEFSLGGNRVGRAFDFNARTADRGAGAGLEIGYRLGKDAKDGGGVELLGFVDGGITHDLGSTVSAARSRSLSSAGIGARFSLAGMTFGVEAGVPLSGEHHKPRLFGSVFRSF